MKYQLGLISFLIFLMSACGPIKSTQSILKAEGAKKQTLDLISRAAEDASIIEQDLYRNKSLNKKAKGEASYFFFKGNIYLKKARELQAGALYEDSFKLADKAIEYFATASAMIAAIEKEPDENLKKPETATEKKKENIIPVSVSSKKEKVEKKKEEQKKTPITPTPVKTDSTKKKEQPQPVVTPKPEEKKPMAVTPAETKPESKTKTADKKKKDKKKEKAKEEVKEKESDDPYANMYEKYKKMAEDSKKKKELKKSDKGGEK